MRLDGLTKPISPDAPCGEDLLEAGDPDFLAYYYDAEAKMPERYISLATGEVFDPKSIDVKGEMKSIETLLKRTIDLRLIALDARFNILGGRIKGFCEAVIAMANVLEAFWEDAHPRIIDGEFFERQNAIEFLDTRATVTAPLEYAPLIVDRRAGEVTWRGYMVASGQLEAREEEAVGDSSAMLNAIGSAENAQDVEALYALLKSTLDACARIKGACNANGAPFAASLDKLEAKLNQLVELLQNGRSDLDGAGSGEMDGDAGEGAEVSADGAPVTMVAAAPVPAGLVKSHVDARASLAGTEAYFRLREPSSPSLILIVQARELVGRPLVEALETLLPKDSGAAVIDLGSDTGFAIRMDRMRELSNIAMSDGKGIEDEPPGEPRNIETRDQAMAEIKAVESFYQTFEPASPIPVLMFKARSFLNKDFQSIVRDLIPDKEK